MKKIKMLCFDMDGTIADLYGVENWLSLLREENPSPYIKAKPMWDMEMLSNILRLAQSKGIKICVITWLSKNSSQSYKEQVRIAKRNWLDEQDFPFDFFHGVQYGTTKANCVRRMIDDDEQAILIDDSAKVRKGWHLGDTINPTNDNIIDKLTELLNIKI